MRGDRLLTMLKLFALLADQPADDAVALQELLRLLELGDPFILLTRDGPALYALAQRFGFIGGCGRERMDALDAELVCRVVVAWERWRQSVLELAGAGELMQSINVEYGDREVKTPADNGSYRRENDQKGGQKCQIS